MYRWRYFLAFTLLNALAWIALLMGKFSASKWETLAELTFGTLCSGGALVTHTKAKNVGKRTPNPKQEENPP